VVAALERDARGLLHLTNTGACSWYEFTCAILELAGVEAEVSPVSTTRPMEGAERPLNGVLACARAEALGLAPLRPWPEALADYMKRAGHRAPADRPAAVGRRAGT
jgi:dTDP-4-dehydrorhamnose reductase